MDKQTIRERVWREMEAKGVVTFPRPARGRIPNFVGSRDAAMRLRSLPAYKPAKTIFVNPDAAQMAVRELALRDGKRLIMATPRLRKGFITLDPTKIKDATEAVSIKGAFKHGQPADIRKLKVDSIVEGSVAVDPSGGRLGKGSGWGDLEHAILREYEAVDRGVPVATTVHDLQVLDLAIPMTPHDIPVDFIATPTRLIDTKTHHIRPDGIIWEELDELQIKNVPLLQEMRKLRHQI